MMITCETLPAARKSFNPANGASLCMTAREFAQTRHSLDKKHGDWAYTPCGEKWGWADNWNVWVRLCESGYKAEYKKNSR